MHGRVCTGAAVCRQTTGRPRHTGVRRTAVYVSRALYERSPGLHHSAERLLDDAIHPPPLPRAVSASALCFRASSDRVSSCYDTIRDAILTCAPKPTRVSLIYRTEPTTEKWKTEKKLKCKKTSMPRRIGKQSGESVESVLKKKRKATVGRICRKGRF